MGYKALLTFDLENGVSLEQRKKAYDYLKEQKWERVKSLTTTWKCSFNDDVTREAAIKECKSDVARAARLAGISLYHAAVQVGKGDVEIFHS